METLTTEKIILDFNQLYYDSHETTWNNMKWAGIQLQKNPMDLWVMQEIIFETKPDLIIETGTFRGGSALYYSHIFDIIGKGHVITIDITDVDRYIDEIGPDTVTKHSRITYITGNSIDKDVQNFVLALIDKLQFKSIMVILDSDHSTEHVIKELEFYSNLVSIGNYLIVEDTNLNTAGKALLLFIENNSNFEVDNSREKFMLTFNPSGNLKRVK